MRDEFCLALRDDSVLQEEVNHRPYLGERRRFVDFVEHFAINNLLLINLCGHDRNANVAAESAPRFHHETAFRRKSRAQNVTYLRRRTTYRVRQRRPFQLNLIVVVLCQQIANVIFNRVGFIVSHNQSPLDILTLYFPNIK